MARQREPRPLASAAERRARLRARRSGPGEGERSKTAFLSIVSHELRTPLNTIIGQADLLLSEGLPPRAREAAAAIRDAGQGLYTILNDILDLARMEAGLAPSAFAELDIRALVDSVRRLHQPQAWARQLDLETAIDAATPTRLAGDPGRIRQTLVNLVGNAVKFTERGGVSINVRMQGEDMLRIEVADTGAGIAPSDRARMFEPFEQAESVLTRRHAGIGLGLALSKRLVESMGGAIGVASRAGCGSTFWFTAPVKRVDVERDGEPAMEGTADADPSLLAKLDQLRILAADDNPVHRQALERLFIAAGARCDLVGDGMAAVEHAQRGAYDVIILDAHMPILDGAQAARMIQTMRRANAGAPILIALSEHDPTEAEARAISDGIIPKPYEARTLIRGIAQVTRDARTGPPVFDSSGIMELERSVGRPALVDILKSFLAAAAEMTERIQVASPGGAADVMEQAARDLAGAASGLGLAALTAAARELSQAARRGAENGALSSQAAALAALTHDTQRELVSLYPDLALTQVA